MRIAELIAAYLGILISAVLSILLIIQSKKLSNRQDNLQKEINKNNEDLQRIIHKENQDFSKEQAYIDHKISLYQYRINCYFTIIEAMDLLYESNIQDTFNLMDQEPTQRKLAERFSKIKTLLLKASKESEVLFDSEVSSEVKKLFELSVNSYNGIFTIITSYSNELNFIANEIKKKNPKDISGLLILLSDRKFIDNLKKDIAPLKLVLENLDMLNNLFKSDKIDKLVSNYIDVKKYGKRLQHN